ncbi:MurR/RpiR family transcriptional regulator [Allofournierella massiliensis]|uniref:MurR/RpiR family transcriptional regulator n=2 Tax=Allofournierella massiliensis TaxID=1650663 RepID=UPI0024B1616D|nr:MurR/RpiR family transcriptional regulator [Fournierella massiliensis]
MQYRRTIQQIMDSYNQMTQVERTVADFFLNNTKPVDLASKNLAKLLYVSEATLSRFAKKCGYKGYREFSYEYERELSGAESERQPGEANSQVEGLYGLLMENSFSSIDNTQMRRIAAMMDESRRIFIFGIGHSGLAAQDFQLRFMRLGLWIQAVSDSQLIQITAALVVPGDLVIAFTMSGRTSEITGGIRMAKARGARTVLFTGGPAPDKSDNMPDEIVHLISLREMGGGLRISPQVPLLMLIDTLYVTCLSRNTYKKAEISRHADSMVAREKPQPSLWDPGEEKEI